MEMATATKPWTRAGLARLPDDGNRYEVLDGRLLVTPLARTAHQRVAFALARRLAEYCDRHSFGEVFTPGAIPFGDNELQPDVMVVPGDPGPPDQNWADLPRPILVAEMLSDATRGRDRGVKRRAYAADLRIATYWMVDIEACAVTVVCPGHDDVRVRDTLRWQPFPEIVALEIPLSGIFR